MAREGDLAAPRFARGCLCFVGWLDGKVAGYGWFSTSPEWIGEIQLEIKPRQREGYIWNCVTVPEYRRKGVFRSVVMGASLAARRLGTKRLWIGSVDIPAERALAPLGFEPALFFASADVAGLHLMRVTAGSNRTLANDACAALGVRPGLVIRGTDRRRH